MTRVLAIKCRGLGDTVLWTSALQALSQFIPDGKIDIVANPEWATLFAADPRVSQVVSIPKSYFASSFQALSLRKNKYGLVLNFHASEQSALYSILAGGKQRVIHHHSRQGRNFFSKKRVPRLGQPMPAIERDLNVVRAIGWNDEPPPTKVFANAAWIDSAKAALHHLGWQHEPLILFSPRPNRPAKAWRIESFMELADRISEKYRIVVPYRSTSELDEFFERTQKRLWWVHTPLLQDLIGLCANISLYVGIDCGIKHLAAALDKPTITMFGPESVGEWHGYDPKRHIAIQKPVLCRSHDSDDPQYAWCNETVCPLSSHACMEQISAPQVGEAIERLGY